MIYVVVSTVGNNNICFMEAFRMLPVEANSPINLLHELARMGARQPAGRIGAAPITARTFLRQHCSSLGLNSVPARTLPVGALIIVGNIITVNSSLMIHASVAVTEHHVAVTFSC